MIPKNKHCDKENKAIERWGELIEYHFALKQVNTVRYIMLIKQIYSPEN